MTKHIALALAALALGTLPQAGHTQSRGIAGDWTTQDGRAVVTIGRCGSAICGRLSRILADTPDGPPVDENNPNPRLRNRPVQGITVVSGFDERNGNVWRGGEIYDPESGRSYNARMTLNGNRLEVTGCVAWGAICRTETWTRR
ncbi:MAG: DUF2147 domain-containing protein [Parasphingopyxis sp.]|uniref:DUF2147 domain-containing protein n=1 Tax=Parasphingopyxis sp. TaxID=1920299 RepID=UPI0032F0196B